MKMNNLPHVVLLESNLEDVMESILFDTSGEVFVCLAFHCKNIVIEGHFGGTIQRRFNRATRHVKEGNRTTVKVGQVGENPMLVHQILHG